MARMARMAREARAIGIPQFQVKLGTADDWQADVARPRLIREVIGPGPILYGDCKSGATRLDATRMLAPWPIGTS
jgi:L-alanine-DL-glutamate epimerase-like enolase superfamily enzyme